MKTNSIVKPVLEADSTPVFSEACQMPFVMIEVVSFKLDTFVKTGGLAPE